MGMADLNKAIEIIKEKCGNFAGKNDERLIELAKIKLELKFPNTYKKFLLDLGCGNIGGYE